MEYVNTWIPSAGNSNMDTVDSTWIPSARILRRMAEEDSDVDPDTIERDFAKMVKAKAAKNKKKKMKKKMKKEDKDI